MNTIMFFGDDVVFWIPNDYNKTGNSEARTHYQLDRQVLTSRGEIDGACEIQRPTGQSVFRAYSTGRQNKRKSAGDL